MEEKRVLLSELLLGAPYKIHSINISIKRYQISEQESRWYNPALVDIDGPRGLEFILIYPHYWQCEFDKLEEYTIPSVSFKDLLLVERVDSYTQAPYYCWEKAITDDLSFSVCKEYFEEEFVKGEDSAYVGLLLHGGLYREAEARTQELSWLLRFETSRYGLEPGQSK